MSPTISTRISIRWPPSPASEPTDTLVFNIGSYFLDLRVLKGDGKTIDWGIAGTKEILSEVPLKCRWHHALDSRSPGSPAPPDQGTMSTLPNGDELEVGEMPCPEQGGRVMAYEEVWRVLEPVVYDDEGGGSRRAWVLRSVDGKGRGKEEDGGDGNEGLGKTFLGRIGGMYLALREGRGDDGSTGQFGARREEWNGNVTSVGERKGGKWEIKYAIGDVDGLPSLVGDGSWSEGEESWVVGQSVRVHGGEYVVLAVEEVG